MMRPWHTWTVFALCLIAVLTGMGWISTMLIRLDHSEARAIEQAQREEDLQLAMWRLESFLGPMLVQEAGRPYFHYSAFYPAQRAYTRMYAEVPPGAVMVPSPLLAGTAPHVLIHFQIDPAGDLTSPQVPTGNARDLAESRAHVGMTRERLTAAEQRLATLRPLLDREQLLACCPAGEPRASEPLLVPEVLQQAAGGHVQTRQAAEPRQVPQSVQAGPQEKTISQQVEQASEPGQLAMKAKQRSIVEQQIRRENYGANLDNVYLANNGKLNWNSLAMNTEVREGAMQAMWLSDDVLIAARRVTVEGESYIQGYQLNWPALQLQMGAVIEDLLPDARIHAVRNGAETEDTRRLAALPVRVIPAAMPATDAPISQPTRVTLMMAWACVLVAAVAVGVLLSGTLTLSERRAAFVSAVSHELRTPLTTFKLYTDLLSGGKVDDASKRARYLKTLRAEANRLSHLVENVLAYARLERNGVNRRIEPITLEDLLDRVGDRLADRAGQAGVALSVEMDPNLDGAEVRADSAAVEQILFNLVDNACKYGRNGEASAVHVEVGHDGRQGTIRVRDHGPGLPRREARRLFRPFTKSAHDAAHSAPGVGLGLTLSRRLARSMGGDLRACPGKQPGACFVLTLPSMR